MAAATLLTVVKAANTGLLVWETVGPLIQGLIENGKLPDTPVTQADLDKDSIDLGMDLDELHAAIEKARDEGR